MTHHTVPTLSPGSMAMLDKKIPPLGVAAVAAVLMGLVAKLLPGMDLPLWVRICAVLVLGTTGAALCIAGVMAFRRLRTTVDPRTPEATSRLATTGVYAFTRNPMYLGFVLLLLAWAVYLASPLSLPVVIGFALYLDRFQIRPEERALAETFGPAFRDYQARVGRWL